MRPLCPECERLKGRIKEAIHASIEANEAWARLLPEVVIDMKSVAVMNEQAQRVAIDDYSRHIRAEHFTPIPIP